MRKYTLASADSKGTVDLRLYESIITEAVHAVMPNASVTVEPDCYYVDPTPKPGDARKIGRQICKSALSQFCIQIPKLFTSIEITKEVNNDQSKQSKHPGGHH